MFNTLLKKRLALSIIYILIAFIIEISFFIVIGQGIPTYIIMDLCIISIVGAILFIIPSYQAQIIILLNLIVLQGLISYLNQLTYLVFSDFISISMFRLARTAIDAIDGSFFHIWLFKIFIIALYNYLVCT